MNDITFKRDIIERLITMNWRYCNKNLSDKTDDEIKLIAKDIYVEMSDEAGFSDTPNIIEFINILRKGDFI